ncbi:type II toxin-antitoxin system RelE/ParE family toxin [Hymenobacter actinosclerus]|uniref:mRNA-degrading endonuclease RelE, toxin component of the RelBE toxin-antitoxin system n=1 Tax=Hymenobacter actinosclerus TaxID=82805 RepID=A0A1I0DQJ0_9BACT|nr:type II toxin-antitoxin system RelE/ParE family toxin [Hymenobacter actinosclerus]SET34194.1 mRNA-degrading endonuclease RelE, toxin component of the RelBE toxin-antitoxin system [Hymenobacter actinosclerus]
MSYKIVFTEGFYRKLKPLIKKYSSIKNDLIQLRAELLADPTAGNALGHNCYKVRMRIGSKNTGKSGGARVITCVKIVDNQIFLLTIYDKADQESISTAELAMLLEAAGLP